MTSPQRLGMVIDAGRCLHCAACVVACKAENAVPAGHSRNTLTEEERGRYPKLSVVMAPAQCMQCENSPCVHVCPTGACYRGAGGIVFVNADDCIGCRYCVQACPYGARYFDEASGTVDKCTFCAHRLAAGLEPACVTTCPTRTRLFGDLADPSSTVAQIVETGRVEVRLPQAGTRPKVYYVLGGIHEP